MGHPVEPGIRMPANLSTRLVTEHLGTGTITAGSEIGLHADQVLLEDVLGTLVMLELEAMNVDRVTVDVAVQYVDHNLLETDNLNGDEHLFLRSACQRYGIWYSRPGTGISHPTHMQRFGRPGALLVGCDSHTAAAGSLGMLAFGAGGLDVALAMIGEPLYLRMPEIWGVHLTGALQNWVSAKDVILEMLRRHGVEGGFGRIIEYYGPGLACLSAMDRHVIANMGAELGATTTLFPSDDRTREFLVNVGRETDWKAQAAEQGAQYDHHDEIDLGKIEPMIAMPSSPANVVRVRDVPKQDIYQAYIGSSANPGFRDFAIAAAIVAGRTTHDRVSFDINPSTREVLQQLVASGRMAELIAAGARVHQPGCNGCIGMGQAPAKGRASLRTVPRNFPGRSGTREDSVFLCSPETAAASALSGIITDPRDLDMAYPVIVEPAGAGADILKLLPPISVADGRATRLQKTANIVSLPKLPTPCDNLAVTVLLTVGDDVSTDDIIPAGTLVMPFWTDIPHSAEFAFHTVDANYAKRAKTQQEKGGLHAIIAGHNYGQGSSRENAALAPRYLGLGLVLAKSFARIHWQNLVNFGVLPLTFADASDHDRLKPGDKMRIDKFADALSAGSQVEVVVEGSGTKITLLHELSERQIGVIRAGGAMNAWRQSQKPQEASSTTASTSRNQTKEANHV